MGVPGVSLAQVESGLWPSNRAWLAAQQLVAMSLLRGVERGRLSAWGIAHLVLLLVSLWHGLRQVGVGFSEEGAVPLPPQRMTLATGEMGPAAEVAGEQCPEIRAVPLPAGLAGQDSWLSPSICRNNRPYHPFR